MRLSAHHLVKYKIANKTTVCFARNISAGGLLLYTQEEIAAGSILEIIINFPGKPKPLNLSAKVLRSKNLKQIGGFEVGCQFLDIDKPTHDYINERIIRILGKENKPK